MARFHASITGQSRTPGTRMGSAKSGIGAHVRGWDVGVRVEGRAAADTDIFDVYVTGGSNNGSPDIHIGEVIIADGQPTFIPKTKKGTACPSDNSSP